MIAPRPSDVDSALATARPLAPSDQLQPPIGHSLPYPNPCMLTRTLLAAISRPPISLKTMSAAARPTRSSRSSAAALALATNASTVPRTVKAEPIVDEEVDVKPSTSSVVKKRRAPSPAASTPKKTRRATPTDAASMTAASPDSKPPKPPAAAGTTPKKFAAYLTSPFPDYSAPTAAECERVTELLAGLHGMPQRPGRVEKLPEGEPPRVGEACTSSLKGPCCVARSSC